MDRLDIAACILAGISANPADAYTQPAVAADKSLLLADVLIEREKETSQEALRKDAHIG